MRHLLCIRTWILDPCCPPLPTSSGGVGRLLHSTRWHGMEREAWDTVMERPIAGWKKSSACSWNASLRDCPWPSPFDGA